MVVQEEHQQRRKKMRPSKVSHVNGYIMTEPIERTGNDGIMFQSNDFNNTVLHETLQFLGLSDRYSEKTGLPFKGYEHDIMGVNGSRKLSISHYRNIVDYANQQILSKPNISTFHSFYFMDHRYSAVREV